MQLTRFVSAVAQSVWRDRRFSAEQFQRLQRQKLLKLLAHARRRVPFQASRLARIDFAKVRLEDIPPTTKSEMMESFDDTIADRVVTLAEIERMSKDHPPGELPVIRDKFLVSRTSGTTGNPGVFVYGLDDYAEVRGAVFARTIRDRCRPKFLWPFAFRRFRAGFLLSKYCYAISWQAARSTQTRMGRLTDVRIFPIEQPLDRTIRELNEFRPDYLHAFPSILEIVAHRKFNGERIEFHPDVISLGSEPTSPAAMQAIHEAFPRAAISNQYGTTECVSLGNSCAHGRIHLNPDYAIVEPRTVSGGPARPGELSDHILITNLINRVQPMIRYRVDDSIRILEAPCPCGRPTRTLEIEGRRSSHFYLIDNDGEYRRVTAVALAIATFRIGNTAQVQVLHVRQNEIVLRIVPGDNANPDDIAHVGRAALIQTLKEHECDRRTSIDVEIVDRLERTGPGGKLQQVESLVPPPKKFKIAA